MHAYLLIQTDDREPLAESLEAIPGIISAVNLYGPYDAIALARADSTRQLNEEIMAEIRGLPGVVRALPAPLAGSVVETRDGKEAA